MKIFEKSEFLKFIKNQIARFSALNDIVFWLRKILMTEKLFSNSEHRISLKTYKMKKNTCNCNFFDQTENMLFGTFWEVTRSA